MVNAQELQGSWNQVKGQVKEKWGNLTDDDLQFQGGNLDQIVGKIQQKTGETREAVEEFLNDLTSRSASALSQAAETAGQYAQRAGHQIVDSYQHVAGHVGEGYEHIERTFKQNPTQTVAVSFGVGLALGVLVGLSLRSR
jgi:uncharacterized protein YjbJ (UPF0337 family)